jgi:hypothetical protein
MIGTKTDCSGGMAREAIYYAKILIAELEKENENS